LGLSLTLAFAVLVKEKVIIEDYVLNEEAAAEFEMYIKDTAARFNEAGDMP
jgi:hypothetical protein